jgi:FkbM family methyltransferase
MKSSGKIYAFEPLTDNYNLLIENIKLNNLKNIILIKKAVCNINGKRKLFAYKKDSVGPSFHKHLDGHPFTVDCITLNDLIKSEKLKKIDLIKLDCEGSEYEIIYNFLKKIFKYYKTFFNGSS